MEDPKPRGRFAPSPSGLMHLGNAWTAFLAWIDTRTKCGTMILRIEDLDPDRSRPEYTTAIMEDLRWLGLDWDEGPDVGGPCAPYCQSQRTDIYQAIYDRLTKSGLVYPCYCSRAELQRSVASAPHADTMEVCYSGRCANIDPELRNRLSPQSRRPSYRLRVADADVGFTDEVFGFQHQQLSTTCGDFIIRRSDGTFAYQLAVVVDDALMGIGRVVRGADLLASTPRQIFLWHLLGHQEPAFLHVPLLVGPDGARLAKRDASLAISALRDKGLKPEMIIGQLAVWAGMLTRVEPVQAKELIGHFDRKALPREAVVVPGNPYLFENG